MHQALHRPKFPEKACEGTFFQRSTSKEKGNFKKEVTQPEKAFKFFQYWALLQGIGNSYSSQGVICFRLFDERSLP